MVRTGFKWLFGALFTLAGLNHFLDTAFYVSIMPPYLPWPVELVYASGAAEVLIGVSLFFRRIERLAAWGAIALIVAVTPVHVHMVMHPALYPQFSEALLWARLPLQVLLIAWAYWFTRPRPGA